MAAAILGILPALLAALFAGWCGNLLGGVTAAGSAAALAVVLAAQAASPAPWHDPLRLGGWGRVAPAALWLAVAASAWISPVPRAGLEAVALVPAYLYLPGAVARCWQRQAARRWGGRCAAAVVLAMAVWALAPEGRATAPGPAATMAPLGHHTLLATWLALLLPLAMLPVAERSPWRWLGAAAGAAGLAAMLASRSLGGAAALAVEAVLAAVWFGTRGGTAGTGAAERRPRWPSWWQGGGGARRWWVAGLVLLGLALAAGQMARVGRIGAGRDPSATARAVYLRAGWAGWRERPWLGWGPGSVAWTAAWFLAPRPGLNPWGEAVGELHSLPIELAYETGALGLVSALAVGGFFLLRRWRERWGCCDANLLVAGCLGLAGGAVAWLSTAALAVPALPLAMAVAAGAALAGGAARTAPVEIDASQSPGPLPAPATDRVDRAAGSPEPDLALATGRPAASRVARLGPDRGAGRAGDGGQPGLRGVAAVARYGYGLLAAIALLAPEMARWHYDRAVAAGEAGRRPAAMAELAAAVHLDPAFPLYRMRLAMLMADRGEQRGAAAGVAMAAAREARGVGLLWLVAGILGQAAGEMWAPAALHQACALDPLSPYPPFYLAAVQPAAPRAPRCAAQALLAEPRLAAAAVWEGREPLFRHALEAVRGWPGVDAGWKEGLLAAAPEPEMRRGPLRRLALGIDTAGFTQSTSLHLFRRLPWPAVWPLVAVRAPLLSALDLPPAPRAAGPGEGAQNEWNVCLRD